MQFIKLHGVSNKTICQSYLEKFEAVFGILIVEVSEPWNYLDNPSLI